MIPIPGILSIGSTRCGSNRTVAFRTPPKTIRPAASAISIRLWRPPMQGPKLTRAAARRWHSTTCRTATRRSSKSSPTSTRSATTTTNRRKAAAESSTFFSAPAMTSSGATAMATRPCRRYRRSPIPIPCPAPTTGTRWTGATATAQISPPRGFCRSCGIWIHYPMRRPRIAMSVAITC